MSWIAVGMLVVSDVTARSQSGDWTGASGGIFGGGGKGEATARDTGKELKALPFSLQRKQANLIALDQIQLSKLYAGEAKKSYLEMERARRGQQIAQTNNVLGMAGKTAKTERKLTSDQRAGDMVDYERLRKASPGVASLDRIGAQAGESSPLLRLLNLDSASRLGGRSDLNAELESQALADLRLGGTLSEQEQRDAEQAARGAWAARGLAHSNGAVGAEILARDSASRARRDSRRSFAGGVSNLVMSEDEALRRYAMGVEGLNASDLSTRASVATTAAAPLLNSFAQRSNAIGATIGAMNLTGRPGEASDIMSQTPSVFQGAAALTPLYNYQADAFNTNLNASESRRIAAQNQQNALIGGAMQAGGSYAKKSA